MATDSQIIIYFWFILFFLGLIFAPLTFRIFKKFYDFGYSFSKIIAIGIISYLAWILGILKLLSFSQINIVVIIILCAISMFILNKAFIKENLGKWKNKWKIFAIEEAMFFIILAGWSGVRAFEPRIEGLEKFMDFGFINSILRSEYFPPKDIWLAGSSINYYYFGQLYITIFAKISGIPSSYIYNLSVALIFALIFAAIFSLSSNIIYAYLVNQNKKNNEQKKHNSKYYLFPMLAGLVSAIITTMAGNFQPLYFYLTHNHSLTSYWYPDASRFIPFTIHEFPMYSIVVTDLHAYFLN